jgi:hypothetical protein
VPAAVSLVGARPTVTGKVPALAGLLEEAASAAPAGRSTSPAAAAGQEVFFTVAFFTVRPPGSGGTVTVLPGTDVSA